MICNGISLSAKAVTYLACSFASMMFIGCGSAPDEPSVQITRHALASAMASTTVAGYAHTLSNSHFRIGQNVFLEVNAPTLQRWRGSNGAFGLDPTNGSSMAILDSDAPAEPYLLDANMHNQQVQNYFIGAGLPADQIAQVITTYQAQLSGEAGIPSGQPQLLSLDSILKRAIQGIPVIESFAWAKMTTSGDVDMEAVFWPPIDQAIVTAAATFAASLTDSATLTAYLAKLPTIVSRVGVVIHHTDSSIHATPLAYVSFDAVINTASSAVASHFDVKGVQFQLPQEVAAAPPAVVRAQ